MIGRFFGGVVSVIVIAGRFVYEVVFVWPTPEERRQSERHEAARKEEEQQDADAVLRVLLPTLGETLGSRAYGLMDRYSLGPAELAELLVALSMFIGRAAVDDEHPRYVLNNCGELTAGEITYNVTEELLGLNRKLDPKAVRDFMGWVVAGATLKWRLIPGHTTRPRDTTSVFVDVGNGHDVQTSPTQKNSSYMWAVFCFKVY